MCFNLKSTLARELNSIKIKFIVYYIINKDILCLYPPQKNLGTLFHFIDQEQNDCKKKSIGMVSLKL